MRALDRWAEQARYWKTVPAGANALVLSGVFCLFAAFGLIFSIMDAAKMPLSQAFVWAMLSGGFSVLIALAGFRRLLWLLVVLVPLQAAVEVALAKYGSRSPALSASAADRTKLLDRVQGEGGIAMLMIMAGYVLVIAFIQKEGRRVFGPMTEVRLAQEVHQALVPAVSGKVGEYEICGTSVPSGRVGGDLVDLIEDQGRWMAYVADVAGHGVPAGMVMAMVKSAARMGAAEGASFSSLLSSLDKVLGSLSAPNVFVTFAGLAGANGANLTFALAGHLPILHYRRCQGVVEERSVSNLPLAAVPDAEFETGNFTCEPGDLVAIVTDGLTESADDGGRELGLEPLKAVLRESANQPLERVMRALRHTSLKHGKQLDDQTVLLVRRDMLLSSPLTTMPTRSTG